jgi:hypothetical protein
VLPHRAVEFLLLLFFFSVHLLLFLAQQSASVATGAKRVASICVERSAGLSRVTSLLGVSFLFLFFVCSEP